jgi:hypothetical protein
MTESSLKIYLARASSTSNFEYYVLEHCSYEQLPAEKQPELPLKLEWISVQGGEHG